MIQSPNSRSSLFALSIRWVLGVVLGTAAVLKLHYLWADPLWEQTVWLAPWAIVLIAQIEFLIATLMVTNIRPAMGWTLGLAFFVLLFVFALASALGGFPACDCFGALKTSPWVAVTIDGFAIVSLILIRPRAWGTTISHEFKTIRLTRSMLAGATTGLLVIGIVFFLIALSDQGRDWLRRMRHDFVVISNSPIDVGTGRTGSQISVPVLVKNRSEIPIRILGGEVSCECMTIAGLPVAVAPHDEVALPVLFSFKGSKGATYKKFVFYCDHPHQTVIIGSISARVN